MVQCVPTLSLFASWITHLWHPKSIPPICSIFLADWLTNLWWTVWDKLPRKLVIIYDIYLKIGYPIPSAGWPLFSSLKWPCLAPNEHQVCHQQQCIHLLSLPPLAGLNVVRSQRPRWFKAQVLQVEAWQFYRNPFGLVVMFDSKETHVWLRYILPICFFHNTHFRES